MDSLIMRNDVNVVFRSDLIDLVIDQIVEDLETGDLTALFELLGFIDDDKLVGYLSDGNGKKPY